MPVRLFHRKAYRSGALFGALVNAGTATADDAEIASEKSGARILVMSCSELELSWSLLLQRVSEAAGYGVSLVCDDRVIAARVSRCDL